MIIEKEVDVEELKATSYWHMNVHELQNEFIYFKVSI